MSIEINVICEQCKKELSASVIKKKSFDEINIEVEPCQSCIDDAKQEGGEL